MKIYTEFSIYDFEPWSGAVYTYDTINDKGMLSELGNLIEEVFDGQEVSETEINDFLWFEDDYIFETLGIKDDEEEEEDIFELEEEE